MGKLDTLDWLVIAVYLLAVFGVAVWAGRRAKTRETSSGYFLAGRNAGWFVIGASLFASNIGSEHLIGLAGAGAASGLAVGHFEVLASVILLALGWVMAPFYLRSAVYTMPEFLERRYSPAARWYLAVISIAGYVLTKISVTLFAGGVIFQELMGLELWQGAVIMVIATGAYTIFGGLRAVLYTDLLQMFVLIGGAIAVTLIGLDRLGGWSEMVEIAGADRMSMWKPTSDEEFPWTGIILGAPILGVWYWCTDQYIVQRVLSARGLEQARGGTIFAGYLKLLPLFIFVLPGVIAYCLSQKGELELSDSNAALPAMVQTLLGPGVRGLVLAGFLAALMSSLSSAFNSCSTLVSVDIYKNLRPRASERQLVIVGQLATVGMVVLGLVWIPFIAEISDKLYVYLQKVQAYIAPPIAAVFLLGVCWKRLNAAGAMASLLTGFVVGAARLIVELNVKQLAEGGPLHAFATINFLHFAALLFVACSVVLVAVSMATRAPAEEQLDGLTFQTTAREAGPSERSTLLVLASLGLLAGVAGTWLFFA